MIDSFLEIRIDGQIDIIACHRLGSIFIFFQYPAAAVHVQILYAFFPLQFLL